MVRLQPHARRQRGLDSTDPEVGSSEDPARDSPSTGHVVRGQLLRTFPLQSISLRQTGDFIKQKRNTKVCKDLPDVRRELERNSYTIVDGQTSILLHFGSGLGLARDSAVWVSDETTRGRADQIKPTIWSICRM